MEHSIKVRNILDRAAQLPADQRAAFLDNACGGDSELRAEIESLLAALVEADEFLNHPTLRDMDISASEDMTRDAKPQEIEAQIGPYRLIERLGEGGMGVVYKAEQRSPIRRVVALKIIKLGFDSAEIIARFESERQALARMDHPGIAKVLDAGTDERGRPYFVMEYVPGTPIRKFADDNRLSTEQRLVLMLQVCEAIGHAHVKMIIHRDIKAGNMLAYNTPEGPRVKVIDFGIAKALTTDRLTDHTFNTKMGQAIGTYETMSPEQADGSPDIDTRTDVYSMGVLLYELLSGTKPFDRSSFVKAAHDEIRRIIREVDPPKPSTRLSSVTVSEGSTIAASHRSKIAALRKTLRHELEWIPLMAMRKERDRRYGSSSEMAEDIRNYLADRPLRAGPESMAYRTIKLARRNRPALLVTAGILILIVAGTTLYIHNIRLEQKKTTAALAETEKQRSKAEARFSDVRQLANDFMFKFDDMLAKISGTTAIRKVLADTALEYLDRLKRDAGNDKALDRELATSYSKVGDILGNPYASHLGETAKAMESYRKSLQICEDDAKDDPGDVDTQHLLAIAHSRIADILVIQGQAGEAMKNYQLALAIDQSLSDKNPQDAARLRPLVFDNERIGSLHIKMGDAAGAQSSFEKSLNIGKKLAEQDPGNDALQRKLAENYSLIGQLQMNQGRTDDALSSYQNAVQIIHGVAERDPENAELRHLLLTGYCYVGDALREKGLNKDALANIANALDIAKPLALHAPEDVRAQRELAACYERMGYVQLIMEKPDAALASADQCLQIRATIAHDHPDDLESLRQLSGAYGRIADVQRSMFRNQEALSSYQHFLENAQKVAMLDPSSVEAQRDVTVADDGVASMQVTLGSVPEAFDTYKDVIAQAKKFASMSGANPLSQRVLTNVYFEYAEQWRQSARSDRSPSDARLNALRSAAANYQLAAEAFQKMKLQGPASPADKDVKSQIDTAIGECNDQIAALEKKARTKPTTTPVPATRSSLIR